MLRVMWPRVALAILILLSSFMELHGLNLRHLVPRYAMGPQSRDFSSFDGLDMYGPTIHDVSFSSV